MVLASLKKWGMANLRLWRQGRSRSLMLQPSAPSVKTTLALLPDPRRPASDRLSLSLFVPYHASIHVNKRLQDCEAVLRRPLEPKRLDFLQDSELT
jgi:hypothetical protein